MKKGLTEGEAQRQQAMMDIERRAQQLMDFIRKECVEALQPIKQMEAEMHKTGSRSLH